MQTQKKCVKMLLLVLKNTQAAVSLTVKACACIWQFSSVHSNVMQGVAFPRKEKVVWGNQTWVRNTIELNSASMEHLNMW